MRYRPLMMMLFATLVLSLLIGPVQLYASLQETLETLLEGRVVDVFFLKMPHEGSWMRALAFVVLVLPLVVMFSLRLVGNKAYKSGVEVICYCVTPADVDPLVERLIRSVVEIFYKSRRVRAEEEGRCVVLDRA